MITRKDIMYQHMIGFQGIDAYINDNITTNKVLFTECEDTHEDGYDLKNIITEVSLNQGDFIKIDEVLWMVLDIKKVTNSSYTLGTIREINHINKFVSNDIIYEVPSICTNISKNKLGTMYNSDGITEAQGIWSFITKYNDISKKINVGMRFIINGDAWKVTSLDYTTDAGILYVVMKVDNINYEIDDMQNEVANGKHTYTITLNSTAESIVETGTFQITCTCTDNGKSITNPNVIFTSNDPTIATIDNSGLVTGIKVGTTSITATLGTTSTVFIATVTAKTVTPVISYSGTWSNSTTLKIYSSSTFSASKILNGVDDSANIDLSYTFDSTGTSLLSSGKVSITKKSNSSYQIKNVSTSTATDIHITFTDLVTGIKVLDNQLISLRGV